MNVKIVCALFLAACFAAPVRAQAVHHLDEVHTPRTYGSLEEWLGRAEALRMRIRVATGLWPKPERMPLAPRVSEPIEKEGYTIESVVLETMPGFYVTGNLYRPRSQDGGPHPAVLSPHGHWQGGRFENTAVASVPGRAIQFARRGYVVLAYSMIGYNETEDVIPHRFSEPRYELWGFSPMGLQLWNSLRALDFLSALPDVDSTRIGMTGASGGATQTFMLTAIDPRIKVAAPVNMISAHMQGGCVCENAPLLRLDATNIDVAALAAPRPLLMVSTSGDWTANTPSLEYPAVRSVYALFGAEARVRNVHLDYPHNYNRESREAVYAWFDRWLKDEEGNHPEMPFEAEDPTALRADLPEAVREIDAVFEDYRRRSIQQVHTARPAGWTDLYAYRDRFGAAFRELFRTVPDAKPIDLVARVPEGRTEASPAVLIVHTGEMEAAGERNGAMIFTLDPHPDDFVVPDSIEHWTTYNATTAARRVDEIRRAVEQLQARPDVTELDLVGLGKAGPWTLLARALVDDVRRTVIDFNGFEADEDAAYVEDFFVPLLRRAGDFKTAAAQIAPARLEIRNVDDGPLREWMRDVYHAAGASEMLDIE